MKLAPCTSRPGGFAVIVVTSNLLIPDSSWLWLGINGQPLETRSTHQTIEKRLKFNSLEIWHLTVIDKRLRLNSKFWHSLLNWRFISLVTKLPVFPLIFSPGQLPPLVFLLWLSFTVCKRYWNNSYQQKLLRMDWFPLVCRYQKCKTRSAKGVGIYW